MCACESERVCVQLFVLGCRADTQIYDIGELYEYVTWYEGARG